MKTMPRIVLALTAFAAIGASAQTVYSGQADQERRERNREEALEHYRSGTPTTSPTLREDRARVREETHEAAQSVRRGTHRVAESTRRVTHKSANTARRVGHKTAVKARNMTDRVEAKYGPTVPRKGRGEAQNPSGTNTTAPNGPK